MFLRLLFQSFRRQQRRKLLAVTAVALGMAVVTAMAAVSFDVGDKLSRELRAYGANIVVFPQEDSLDVRIGGVSLKPAAEGAFLKEADLPRIKGIFWRNNITAFAPFLPAQADLRGQSVEVLGTWFDHEVRFGNDSFRTGAPRTQPWWTVAGRWPRDTAAEAAAGERLAQRLGLQIGDSVMLGQREVTVVGIARTGGDEDLALLTPLFIAQELNGRPGAVRRVLVSAVTKPEDAFARRDPDTMTPPDRDRWYCSPYANSIAYQLREVLSGAEAVQVRRVAQNEGRVLSQVGGLMLLLALAAAMAAAVGVAAAMSTSVYERRREVGLMKAIGASPSLVSGLFYAEAFFIAAVGGAAGFALGALLARFVGLRVFGSPAAAHPALLPVVVLLALVVTVAASAASIRGALRFAPAAILRGDA